VRIHAFKANFNRLGSPKFSIRIETDSKNKRSFFFFNNQKPELHAKNTYLSFSLVSYAYTGFLRVCNGLHTNEVYNHKKDSATATVKTNSSCVLFIVLSLYSGKLVEMKKKSKGIAISYRLVGMIIIMQSPEESRFFHRNINQNKYFSIN
jgi:hypothetical protein